MGRRYADRVDVVHRDGAPEQFLWRDQVHQVREVHAHWRESGGWWHSAPTTALLAGDMPHEETRALDLDDGEREFWQVEVSAGRCAAVRVVDLCQDTGRGRWFLTRVHD